MAAQRYSDPVAAAMGAVNEMKGNMMGQGSAEYDMDNYNNSCGRSYAPFKSCEASCEMGVEGNELVTIGDDNGSPMYSQETPASFAEKTSIRRLPPFKLDARFFPYSR